MSLPERASLRLNRPESGVLTRKDKYLLLFGNLHSKQFMFYLHTALIIVGVWGLLKSSGTVMFDPPPIPGIDGHAPLWYPGMSEEKPIPFDDAYRVPVFVTHPTPPRLPYLAFARSTLLLISFIYFVSGFLGYLAMWLVDKVYAADRFPFPLLFNPTVILIPYVLSIASLSLPLMLWTMRVIRGFMIEFRGTIPVPRSMPAAEYFSPSTVAIVFIWMAYAYLIYGVVVALMYAWHRAENWYKVPNPQMTPRRDTPTSQSGGSRRFKNPLRSSGGRPTGRNLFQAPAEETLVAEFEIEKTEFVGVSRVLHTVSEETKELEQPDGKRSDEPTVTLTHSETASVVFTGGTSV